MNDAKKARGYFQRSEPLTNDQKIEREARLKMMDGAMPRLRPVWHALTN